MMEIIGILNIKNNLMLSRQRGAAAIEFALLLILLLTIMAGIVEFGRAFWYYDALAKATRDSARYLTKVRESATIAINAAQIDNAKEMVVNAALQAKVPNFTAANVSVSCDSACTLAPTYLTVSINAYPVTIGGWIPIFLSTGVVSLNASISPETTMRYMK